MLTEILVKFLTTYQHGKGETLTTTVSFLVC